ncbi:NAD(P)H azoreductase [Shimia sp. SK013]|uniref:NmrA family NAD(P)-binding protein n=1 Tax=Shimia sp. SK013 TaxID=1389006 RepID=UPI0006B618C4|nr:NmrA family NAD(P)-binding protein [Shimia sp. SK013]KPA21127.1 NAD(P)H azoreductase [Shimia sp. SK013]
MSARPKILVTSATGKTGVPTVLQLLEKGFPVRAFVRKLDDRSQALEHAGAEVFLGNQYSITDMRAAMNGVQRAYQCAPTAPNGSVFNAVFTAAAYEAQLEHVVTLSQWLASPSHPSQSTRDTYIGDILIRMRSEMTVTTVSPGWFADNYLSSLDSALHLGVFSMPLGDGNVKKNAPPSNEDIASVVVGALIDPDTHAGKRYRPTGPELLSPNDIAAAIGQALGRRVKYQNISPRLMLKALKATAPPNYSVVLLEAGHYYTDEYRRGSMAVGAPTTDVETVGGRTPENFESIARRYVAARPKLRPSLAGKLKAIGGFLKILITRAPDVSAIETQKDYIKLKAPAFCLDDDTWRESHASTELKPISKQVA